LIATASFLQPRKDASVDEDDEDNDEDDNDDEEEDDDNIENASPTKEV
jgi:hypothetical protein